MTLRIFLLFCLLLCSACNSSNVQQELEEETTERLDPTVLLISLDGFRWDYFEKTNTPNLDLLIDGNRFVR